MTPEELVGDSRGILGGETIHAGVAAGLIRITPFSEKQVNPASYDLRLGPECRVYCGDIIPPVYGSQSEVLDDRYLRRDLELDSRKENPTMVFEMSSSGFRVDPGRVYLMHTVEELGSDHFVPVVDGKSSIGRLGLQVHATAGYGDPGFFGQITLEVSTVGQPVWIYPGMRIAQLRFHTIAGKARNYREGGHYQGEAARGAVASKSWWQFEEAHPWGCLRLHSARKEESA